MKKTVPFEFFGENQTIYFDVLRIAELEDMIKMPVYDVVRQSASIKLAIAGLVIGLKHHYPGITPAFVIGKMEEHFEHGGTLSELVMPIGKAIVDAGVFGGQGKEEKNS